MDAPPYKFAHCGNGACRFAVVGWLKMFVGLARDRFDSLVSSPTATLAAHARTLALLLLLFVNDVAWIVAFLSSREAAPVSHIMLWLFDTVVAALEAAAILVKYGEPRSLQSGRTRGLPTHDGAGTQVQRPPLQEHEPCCVSGFRSASA